MGQPARPKIALEELHRRAGDACFVAMDFSPKHEHVFDELIAPVVQNSGLLAIRGDQVLSAAGNVVDEVIGIIQRARLVVVDITGLNANVLIELGIAHALHRPIVLVSQDSVIPFDIQPQRVLRYDLSEAGRLRFKDELQVTLRTSIYPSEHALRRMFPLEADHRVLVVHGAVSERHVATVSPPVDAAYGRRLSRRSSTTSGIWDIAMALQRVALSRGIEAFRMDAVDGNRSDAQVLADGHVVCLGGPVANPLFTVLAGVARKRFLNAPSLDRFDAGEDRVRYRVTRDGTIHPDGQDELIRTVDYGLVMRMRNPERAGAFAWIAAGVRAYGTEGAVAALTRPTLIASILDGIDDPESAEFWALVRVDFDPDTAQATAFSIAGAEALREREGASPG